MDSTKDNNAHWYENWTRRQITYRPKYHTNEMNKSSMAGFYDMNNTSSIQNTDMHMNNGKRYKVIVKLRQRLLVWIK